MFVYTKRVNLHYPRLLNTALVSIRLPLWGHQLVFIYTERVNLHCHRLFNAALL